MSDLISRAMAIEALENQTLQRISETLERIVKILEDEQKARTIKESATKIHSAVTKPSAQPVGTPLHDSGTDYAHGYEDGYRRGLKDAQPERKIGKWIISQYPDNANVQNYKCEFCEKSFSYNNWTEARPNFCLNCGADMREEDKA